MFKKETQIFTLFLLLFISSCDSNPQPEQVFSPNVSVWEVCKTVEDFTEGYISDKITDMFFNSRQDKQRVREVLLKVATENYCNQNLKKFKAKDFNAGNLGEVDIK